VSALSDVLRRANNGGLSARQVSRLARERGFTLNHDTAARYMRGDHGQPDESTIMAFAQVLDIGLEVLRAAAGLPHEQIEPYVPPHEASRLNRRQRRAVDELIRAMLDSRSGSATITDLEARRSHDATNPTPDPTANRTANQTDRAARRGKVEPPSA
jgi:hypothetical protein